MSENAALAAECLGGPLDGTLAVIRDDEFPVKIHLQWNDRRAFYRRRQRRAEDGTGYVVYYEYERSQPPLELRE